MNYKIGKAANPIISDKLLLIPFKYTTGTFNALVSKN
jgi:hypothetical protein